jgi:uncharacterized protein (TIGR02246 family)
MTGTPGHELPERGFSFLADEVRRKQDFPRAEVERELARYFEVADAGIASGDYSAWVDLFTDDAVYVEHASGVMRGPEAIRAWVEGATGGQPMDLVAEVTWRLIDNDLCVVYCRQGFPAPDGGSPFQFVAMVVLCYAGDGKWCYEEDVYNPMEAGRVAAGREAAR